MLSRINRAEKRKKFSRKNNYTLQTMMHIKKKHKLRDIEVILRKKEKK